MQKVVLAFLLFLSSLSASAQVDTNVAVYGRSVSGILGYYPSVNLNSVGDTNVDLKASKYIIRKVTVTNCSTGPSLAQVGFYTGAKASGTNFVVPVTITSLKTPATFLDMTITNITNLTLTASTLYIYTKVAQGSTLTCDVYLIGDSLP